MPMANAGQHVWIGATGSWSDATKWVGGLPNDPIADVFIDLAPLSNAKVSLNQSATIRSLTLNAGDELLQGTSGALYLAGVDLRIDGLWQMGGSVHVLGDSGLSGSGVTRLAGTIYGRESQPWLTVATGHVMEVAGGSLGHQTWQLNLRNEGSISVLEGAELYHRGGQLDNRTGWIDLARNSALRLNGASLQGGLIRVGVGAQITGTDAFDVVSARIQGDAWVDRLRWTDIVWDGKSQLRHSVLAGSHSITADSEIQLTDARITGATWLKGAGLTRVVNYLNGSVADSLWIDSGHTFVQTAGSSLGYYASSSSHLGMLANGGVWQARNAHAAVSVIDNRLGRLELMDGSLTLYGAQFVGGQVHGWGSASWLNLLNGSRLADVGFSGLVYLNDNSVVQGSLQVSDGSLLRLKASGGASQTRIHLAGDTVLSGLGTTELYGWFLGQAGTETLRIADGHWLRIGNQSGSNLGWGGLARVVNEGDIEITSGSKVLASNGVLESLFGTVHFDGDTSLTLGSASAAVGGDWRVFVGAAGLRGQGNQSRYSLMVLSGNLLDVPGWGFDLDNAHFSNFALIGHHRGGGYNGVTFSGYLENLGSLTLTRGSVYVGVDEAWRLRGPGEILLPGAAPTLRPMAGQSHATITQGEDHLMRGGAYFGQDNSRTSITLENNGRLFAEGDYGFVFLQQSQLLNRGQVRVAAGSRLLSLRSVLQDEADASIEVNGLLRAPVDLQKGLLWGGGKVEGVVTVNQGHIAPGNSPGKLTIQGDLVLSDASVLEIEIGGYAQGIDHDWLQVLGKATLAGAVQVSFFDGFTPRVGDTFTFLTVSGMASGSLATGSDWFDVEAVPGGWAVRLTDLPPVPEPDTGVLLIVGLGLVWIRRTQSIAGQASDAEAA